MNAIQHRSHAWVLLGLLLGCDTAEPDWIVESSARSGTTTTHRLRIGEERRQVETIAMGGTTVVLVAEDAEILAAAVESERSLVYFADDEQAFAELPEALDEASAVALEAACAGELPEPAADPVFRLMQVGNPFACSYERAACRFAGGGVTCDVQYYDCMSGL